MKFLPLLYIFLVINCCAETINKTIWANQFGQTINGKICSVKGDNVIFQINNQNVSYPIENLSDDDKKIIKEFVLNYATIWRNNLIKSFPKKNFNSYVPIFSRLAERNCTPEILKAEIIAQLKPLNFNLDYYTKYLAKGGGFAKNRAVAENLAQTKGEIEWINKTIIPYFKDYFDGVIRIN